MAKRPVVFIGSSSEGKPVAEAVQYLLAQDQVCEPILWSQGLFAPGSVTLEALVSQISKFDFAILIFSPDDFIETRGIATQAPRDNVLLELGLFIGGLGRHRTFVIFDNDAKMRIPSDLAGVTLVPFWRPRAGTMRDALGPACIDIKSVITVQGALDRSVVKRELPPMPPPSDSSVVEQTVERLVDEHRGILGAESPPLSLDFWYAKLRPALHEVAYYTMPTYFLDLDLNIIDWNISYELIFSEIIGMLRYRHVNQFIARLANYDEVFGHARQFTQRVHKGELPFIDLERLVYRSNRYGDVTMLKVATQMHDISGNPCGWSVGLMVQEIDWPLFQRDLERRIREDKLWSVYSASYDRILTEFPPYKQLIQDVISVIPEDTQAVVDVGAGTGNTTEVLLEKGYRVTSIELNAKMIDRMRAKNFDRTKHKVLKASADNMESLKILADEAFDAAVLVNVLYSLEDPLACLTNVYRILKRGGVLGLSTTHAGSRLDPLLQKIKETLQNKRIYERLADDYGRIYDINKQIERTIAGRVSATQYKEFVQHVGFEIIKIEEYTYEDAVMLIHAQKR
jgi:ubiquinone/menaquinone biosynthesis C-methylase UbiE